MNELKKTLRTAFRKVAGMQILYAYRNYLSAAIVDFSWADVVQALVKKNLFSEPHSFDQADSKEDLTNAFQRIYRSWDKEHADCFVQHVIMSIETKLSKKMSSWIIDPSVAKDLKEFLQSYLKASDKVEVKTLSPRVIPQ